MLKIRVSAPLKATFWRVTVTVLSTMQFAVAQCSVPTVVFSDEKTISRINPSLSRVFVSSGLNHPPKKCWGGPQRSQKYLLHLQLFNSPVSRGTLTPTESESVREVQQISQSSPCCTKSNQTNQITLLTDIVGEGPFEAVKDKPAFLPGLDLASHLHQVALAHLLCEDDLVAGVHAVARRLHVGAQVELLLPDGQVASHGTSLSANKNKARKLKHQL